MQVLYVDLLLVVTVTHTRVIFSKLPAAWLVRIPARIFGAALPVKWKIFLTGTIPNITAEFFFIKKTGLPYGVKNIILNVV